MDTRSRAPPTATRSVLGYHPLAPPPGPAPARCLFSRMRKGSAGSSRGVVRFVDELVAMLKRAGATGPTTVRADSGFWSWKLIQPTRRPQHQVVDHRRSTARYLQPQSGQIGDDEWRRYRLHDRRPVPRSPKPPMSRAAARTKRRQRTVRLVVRRTRLTETVPTATVARLAPPRLHHQHAPISTP